MSLPPRGAQVNQIPKLFPGRGDLYRCRGSRGGRAALIFNAHSKTQGAYLLEYRDRAEGANPFFLLERFTGASA